MKNRKFPTAEGRIVKRAFQQLKGQQKIYGYTQWSQLASAYSTLMRGENSDGSTFVKAALADAHKILNPEPEPAPV